MVSGQGSHLTFSPIQGEGTQVYGIDFNNLTGGGKKRRKRTNKKKRTTKRKIRRSKGKRTKHCLKLFSN